MINELETISLRAVALKDPEYFQRRVCRYYSEKFHTPLMEVFNLPWPFVFQNYLEHLIESNNTKEDLYQLAIDVCYPEMAKEQKQEVSNWHKQIEAREKDRRESKNPHIEEKKPQAENPHIEEEEIHMNKDLFSHLDEEMEDGEGE